jgi:polysaccharide pyruvyl transferase WcaK-like protein
MKNYDFVFGSRFHGNIIALQAGTPACLICHDTRTSEMAEFLGLPFVRIKDIQKIDVDFLYDQVNPNAIQARYRQLYPEYKRFLRVNGLETNME